MVNKSPFFNFDDRILQAAENAEKMCSESFRKIEETEHYNQQKVLAAFAKHRISETHFYGSTGFGKAQLCFGYACAYNCAVRSSASERHTALCDRRAVRHA